MLATRAKRRKTAIARAKRPNAKTARFDTLIKLLVDRHTELTVLLAIALAEKRLRYGQRAAKGNHA
jgi:hypothetical protein